MPRASRLLPLICLLVSLCAPALAAQRGFFAMDTYMAISARAKTPKKRWRRRRRACANWRRCGR